MSITDELREWKGNINTRLQPETVLALRSELNCIADRIDAEYEQMQYGFQREFDEWKHDRDTCWVKLPVDADGEYIHIGDVMVYADGNTCPMKVVALVPPSVFLTDDGPRYADMCRHKPTTVEDVLWECCHKYHSLLIDDMNDAINGVERDYIAPAEIIAEYAAKLRLASDTQ